MPVAYAPESGLHQRGNSSSAFWIRFTDTGYRVRIGCAYSATRSSSIIQRISCSSGDGSTPAGRRRQLGRVLVGDRPDLGRPLRVAGRVGAQLVDPQLGGLQVAGEVAEPGGAGRGDEPGRIRAFTCW